MKTLTRWWQKNIERRNGGSVTRMDFGEPLEDASCFEKTYQVKSSYNLQRFETYWSRWLWRNVWNQQEWLFKFLKRQLIVAKKNLSSIERSWSFRSKNCLMYITFKKIMNRINYSYQPVNIIAFDELPVLTHTVSDITVDILGKKKLYENMKNVL